jgi:hypothetical protein
MNPRPLEDALDPDLRMSAAALQRAAVRASELALQTGTALVVSGAGRAQAISSPSATHSSKTEFQEPTARPQDRARKLTGDSVADSSKAHTPDTGESTDVKTTVEVPSELLERCMRQAQQEGTTLRAVIEEGLHLVLRARAKKRPLPFAVQPFAGDGLTPEFESAGWKRISAEGHRDGS